MRSAWKVLLAGCPPVRAAEAGADTFVAGSAVYGAEDPGAAITALRGAARSAQS